MIFLFLAKEAKKVSSNPKDQRLLANHQKNSITISLFFQVFIQ